MNWQITSADQLGLTSKATAGVSYTGRLYYSEPGTLFLSRQGEAFAFWKPGTSVRIWVLAFQINSAGPEGLSDVLKRPPGDRIIELSAGQQRLFCDIFLRIASEASKDGSLDAAAASAWLTIQLVTVIRWFAKRRGDIVAGNREVDPQCLELWQKIHQHAYHITSAEPMLVSRDPSYDSLRHRFQKAFGVSPRGLLVRMRMNRAKELLRTRNISIKEVASELGYTKQHEFTRAFSRFFGKSPAKWKREGDDSALLRTGTTWQTAIDGENNLQLCKNRFQFG